MSEFVDFLHEVFASFGVITTRRMFGGFGVYHEGVMFGLVADDALYLKVDREIVGEFEAQGLEPFTYVKSDRPMQMSYHQAPEIIFDDPDAARDWANKAYGAALRSKRAR